MILASAVLSQYTRVTNRRRQLTTDDILWQYQNLQCNCNIPLKMYKCIICIQIEHYCKFLAEYEGKGILKIGQHLAKLLTNNDVSLFMTQSVDCITLT